MPNKTDEKLDAVVELLRNATRVLFITGAGISADSGLPTYRGLGGLYNQNRTAEGYRIEECLSGPMFLKHPEITWKYMLQLGMTIAEHEPNDAHRILAEWEQRFAEQGGKLVILTQNIDGYHRAAGSKNVYEFHGSLGTLHCTQCSWSEQFELNESVQDRLRELQQNLPPRCPKCNAVIRPQVVLFEENLPPHETEAFRREFYSKPGFDLALSVGTSAMFYYIIEPVRVANSRGIPTVDINPVEGELSREAAIHLPLCAAEAIQEIERRWQEA